MSMSKYKSFTRRLFIKKLIEEEVKKHLLEQEEEPDLDLGGGEDTSVPDTADSGDIDLGGGDDLGDGADEGGLDLGGDDLGASGGGGDGLDLGDDTEEGSDDFSGGMGGGGFSGGGGGFDFGSGGDAGLEPDSEEEDKLSNTVGPEDVEMPDDPVLSITDDAIKMLGQTKEPAKIFKNTKALMQKYFDDFEDATPVIKSLWDTEDITLRDVARRLLLFIKGV